MEGYVNWGEWMESFEASEFAAFWHLVDTRLRVAESTDFKSRILKLIEDQRLYMDYGLSIDLQSLIGDDVDEFLEVLWDVKEFVSCAEFPLGDSFYGGFSHPEIARKICLEVYPEGTPQIKILWPLYQIYVLVATLGQRSIPMLNLFGWGSNDHPVRWCGIRHP